MESVVCEIERAVASLHLQAGAIEALPAAQSEAVYLSALHHFVSAGDPHWWWESFREAGASVSFEGGDGWKHLPNISPDPNESVWFIAEDDQLPRFPVFETTPQVASSILGECYAFEYYLIAKDLSWLICENHHNVIFAIGSTVEQRLSRRAA